LLANIVLAIFLMTVSALTGYWAQDRSPPVETHHIEAVNSPVPPGATLKIRYDITRHRVCHVRLQQFIFDGENTRFAVNTTDLPTDPAGLGEEKYAVPVDIPTLASPGPARYRAVRSYTCNPLQFMLDWPIPMITTDVAFEIRAP
jgi:hypothetical protein